MRKELSLAYYKDNFIYPYTSRRCVEYRTVPRERSCSSILGFWLDCPGLASATPLRRRRVSQLSAYGVYRESPGLRYLWSLQFGRAHGYPQRWWLAIWISCLKVDVAILCSLFFRFKASLPHSISHNRPWHLSLATSDTLYQVWSDIMLRMMKMFRLIFIPGARPISRHRHRSSNSWFVAQR